MSAPFDTSLSMGLPKGIAFSVSLRYQVHIVVVQQLASMQFFEGVTRFDLYEQIVHHYSDTIVVVALCCPIANIV